MAYIPAIQQRGERISCRPKRGQDQFRLLAQLDQSAGVSSRFQAMGSSVFPKHPGSGVQAIRPEIG